MAQNYIESGEVLDWTATAATTSGQVVVIGAMVGVAMGDAAIGEVVAVRLKGVYEVPKATGAITLGAKVYWNGTSATATATDNTFMGYAWTAQISADTVVRVVLAQ